MENTQNPFTPPQAGPKKSNKLKIIIAVLILAVIGGAGYFFIQSDLSIFQGKMVKLSNDKELVKPEKKSAQNNAQSNQNGSSKSGINTCRTEVFNGRSCNVCYDYSDVVVSRRCLPDLEISLRGDSPVGDIIFYERRQDVVYFKFCANRNLDIGKISGDLVSADSALLANADLGDFPTLGLGEEMYDGVYNNISYAYAGVEGGTNSRVGFEFDNFERALSFSTGQCNEFIMTMYPPSGMNFSQINNEYVSGEGHHAQIILRRIYDINGNEIIPNDLPLYGHDVVFYYP